MKSLRRAVERLLGTRRDRRDLGAELVRGSAGVLIVKVVGVGISFAAQLALTNVLGAEGYGRYAYPLAWVNVLLLFGVVGFDTASLRFVSAYRGNKQWGLLRGFLRRSYQTTGAAAVGVSAVVVLLLWIFGDQLAPGLQGVFWIIPILVPIQVLMRVGVANLRSLRHVLLSQLPDSIFRPSLLAIGVIGISLAFSGDVSPATAMSLEVGIAIISTAFVTVIAFRKAPKEIQNARPDYRTREWAGVAWTLFLLAGFRIVLNRTDVLMVGAFLGTTEAGVFTVAVRVTDLISFGLAAVNTIAAPMFSQLHAQGNTDELQRIILLATRAIFAVTVPASLGVILVGKFVLGLFGNEFVSGYGVLVVLLSGQIVNALAGSVGYLMAMTGHQKESARVIGICAALNVVLNLALIPLLGAVGAAIATGFTTIVWNVVLVRFVTKNLGLSSSVVVKWLS